MIVPNGRRKLSSAKMKSYGAMSAAARFSAVLIVLVCAAGTAFAKSQGASPLDNANRWIVPAAFILFGIMLMKRFFRSPLKKAKAEMQPPQGESAKQAEDSTYILKNILNGMDAYLYVSDLDTDEILFINDKMKQHFYLGEDAVGSICWKVLQDGFTERCSFCPSIKLKKDPHTPVLWEEHNTVTGRYYRNLDCVIDWTGGRKVHLQHSTDITELKLSEVSLSRRLKQQELMSAVSQSFTSTRDTPTLIGEALKMAGEFMGVNQAFLSVYRQEEDTLECLYEWFDDQGLSFIESESKWPLTTDMQIYHDLTVVGHAAIADYESLTHPNFGAIRQHNVRSFLNIAVEIAGGFWGVLGFIGYGEPREWDDSDIYLGKLLAGTFSGVISRNQAEESLFDTQRMLSAVLENAPIAIFWKDSEGIYRGGNTYYERFLGKSAEEFIGKRDQEIFDPELSAQIMELDSAFLAGGERVNSQDIQMANGKRELRWIHLNRSLVGGGNRESSMVIGIFEDITERKETEKELLRMSAIVNTSPQYIAYANGQGHFNFLNPAAEVLTGYSIQELEAGGLPLLFDAETKKLLQDVILPTVFSQGEHAFEAPVVRKDGQVRTMAFSAFAIEADQYGIGIIASDVTDQKQMESDLIRAKDEAEQASRAKGEFLSRMSHEMRTPMNAIIGMTNIAQRSNEMEKKDYCLGKIGDASTHLLGVINDILDMSKIEANKFDLSPVEFNFEKMLQKTVNVINFRIDEKQQIFTVHIDSRVPRTLVGDEQRLAQVITNLLSNAVKFTPAQGAVRLSAALLEETSKDCLLQIEIADTGIGISPEQQARIFTSFEQAENSTSRKFGGTGLGLAISKSIVEMMGGRIWVTSQPGEGSTFAFAVRLERGREKQQSLLSPEVNWSNLRVLVVDDMPEVREYFMDIAGQLGISCDAAADGMEALARIEQNGPYDLCFVDWKMPGMDGIELSRRIKSDPTAHSVVIMISVADWSAIEKEAQNAGVDKFLSKPLFPSSIADCINDCLGLDGIPEETARGEEQAYCFKGCHVLLAEDVEINREIVLALLEPTGLELDCAKNGLEAVEMYRKAPGRYDMIFMDLQMPEMDGYEATRAIRRLDIPETATVPIIAMTANVFKEDIEKCLAEGMNDHVGKPLNLDEVLGMLRKYLAKAQQRHAAHSS